LLRQLCIQASTFGKASLNCFDGFYKREAKVEANAVHVLLVLRAEALNGCTRIPRDA
jgi:hypothetical protein